MNVLQTKREELAALVATATGYRGRAFVPEAINESSAIVVPGSTYVSSGDRFGTVNVSFGVLLVEIPRDNETAANRIDDAIEDTLVALINADWSVGDTLAPQTYDFGGITVYATEINATTAVAL